MAWKKPAVYLTNSKKHYCRLCKCDLIKQELVFEMMQIKGEKHITVKEKVLFCPSCKNYFITQGMSYQLIQRYPGYYVNTSVYDLKPSKQRISATHSNTQQSSQVIRNEPTSISSDRPPQNPAPNSQNQNSIGEPVSGLNAEVFLANTYATADNICPVCSSVLGKESVNIPVIEINGDFYRYYAEIVKYCYNCRKAFVEKDNIASIISKINSTSKVAKTVKLENAKAYYSEHTNDYIFSPTLNNTYAIFHPGHDYRKVCPSRSEEIELNAQSFLGKMGYSVSKGIDIRHHILIEAIKIYGKRRVSDHIAFLIATRSAQINGERKYAHALRTWQEDLNYISEI